MIIKKLTLFNFGVYEGESVFEFSGNKPVVLIGGLNGRGKTTFLEAILLSLYGSNSFAYEQSKYKSFGQYLKAHVNENDGSGECFVELEFILDTRQTDAYRIKRSWSSKPKRVSEKIRVIHNDIEDEFLTNNWLMFIESVLPSALSTFFFFDGEKIAELAVDDTDEQMKESIRALLGISSLDRLKSDLNRLIKKTNKNRINYDQFQDYERLRKEKESLEKEIEETDLKINNLENRISETKNLIEEANNSYTLIGGKVSEERENLISQKESNKIAIQVNRDQLLNLAGSGLPLLMVKEMLTSALVKAKSEHSHQINLEIQNKVKEIYRGYSKGNPEIDGFIEYLNTALGNDSPLTEPGFRMSAHGLYQLETLLDNELTRNISELNALIDEAQQLNEKQKQVDSYLSLDINDDHLKKALEKIRRLEEIRDNNQLEYAESLITRRTLNGKFISVNSALKKQTKVLLNSMEMNDDADREFKYANMSIEILGEYTVRLQKRKTELLAKTITDCYRRLANKKNMIESISMDPNTLELVYHTKDGVLSKQTMSAGEKQLMVVSILWALAICSKRKLPVIIDTPLSRLDSQHRESLVKTYFPNASEQTIILSTDSEIDMNYYEMIKDQVSDTFTLVYDDERQSTRIQKGYFGGEI